MSRTRNVAIPGAVHPAEPAQAEIPVANEYQAPRTGRFIDKPASEVDPTTLAAPVLTRDGWVVPAPKEA